MTEDGIRLKIGVNLDEAPLVMLKEDLDNSVSAAEKAADPRVSVYVASYLQVIGNNGEQFPIQKIGDICDPHYRATSKIFPRFDRGLLGQYQKTKIGIQSLLGSYVLLVTKDVAYKIHYERAGNDVRSVIEKVEAKMFDENNVTEFHTPLMIGNPKDLIRYAINYVCCNPHVTFVVNGREFKSVCERHPPAYSSARWLGGYKEFRNIVWLYVENFPSSLTSDFAKEFSDGSIDNEIVNKPLMNLTEKELEQLYNLLLQVKEPQITSFTAQNYADRLNQITHVKEYGYASTVVTGKLTYILEVLAAKVSSTEMFYSFEGGKDKPLIICSVNSSPLFRNIWYGTKGVRLIYGGEREDLFEYITQRSAGKCNLLIVNLWIPKPSWTSYSKSELHIGPFLNTFRKLLKKALRELKGGGRKISNARVKLEEEIYRRIAIRNLLGQIPPHEWTTQNGLWYKIRKSLGGEDKMGLERKSFLDAVDEICKKYGYSRDELGITCAPRGEFYYRGEVYPLSFENIEKLARMGTDIVHIEKEGVPRALKDVAREYPIAFTHSRGFLVEYGERLIELSRQYGAHVVMLTDLDDAGLVMEYQLPGIPRIGVDEEMIQYFGLNEEDLREKYNPGSHLAYLRDVNKEKAVKVSKFRIEIDSVLAEVGPVKLFEYILYKLCQLFPERNYNRAIEVNPVLPSEVNELIDAIRKYLQNITGNYIEEIKRRLQSWPGLERVDRLKEEIEKELLSKELGDKGFRAIIDDIRKIIVKINEMMQISCERGGGGGSTT